MKLHYHLIALATVAITTTASAQTLASVDWTSKSAAAKKAATELKKKQYQKAATTVLTDKDVAKRVKLDAKTRDKLTSTNPKTALHTAKTQLKKDPVAYGNKVRSQTATHRKKALAFWRKHHKTRHR